jgi:hypothetical protein
MPAKRKSATTKDSTANLGFEAKYAGELSEAGWAAIGPTECVRQAIGNDEY